MARDGQTGSRIRGQTHDPWTTLKLPLIGVIHRMENTDQGDAPSAMPMPIHPSETGIPVLENPRKLLLI
jgi:hypothetical protein